MYQLNITTKVNHQIVADWISWHKEVNIPLLMDTGCFTEFSFSQLLNHDDEEGTIFVTQLMLPSLESYNLFLKEFDDELAERNQKKWGAHYISFRTLMKKM